MKKIAIMYDFFSEYGGIERVIKFQANALREAGYDVSLAFAYVEDNIKNKELGGFNVIEYGKLFLKNESLQISLSTIRNDILREFEDFDLIICHSFPASLIAFKIKRRYGIPYVLNLHHLPKFLYGADLNWAKNSMKRKVAFVLGKILSKPVQSLDSRCVRNAKSVITVGKSVQDMLNRTYGVQSAVIPPPLDGSFRIMRVNPKILSKYGIDKDYILSSGRIVRQKRPDYLINAFSKLKNNGSMQLVFAGEYDSTIKKEIDMLRIQKRLKPEQVIFTGPLELFELIMLYNLASATVLACPKEGFGMSLTEAMACGCPVVAWGDNAGPQETVINGRNGYLAKPYDVGDFAKAIQRTLGKKWDKKTISKTVDRFSEKRVKKILLEKIREIV